MSNDTRPTNAADTTGTPAPFRSRRAMAAVGAGTVAISAAIAIPAFALRTDDAPADAAATASSAPTTTASAAEGAPTTTAPKTPDEVAADFFATATPEEAWMFQRMFWTPEEELAFKLWVATPEEREAFITFTTPPPPPPPVTPVTQVTPAAAGNGQGYGYQAAATASSGGGGGGFLDCVRNRESRGQYGAVNGSSGAGGAYQFMPQTWNNTAAYAGRSDLVGVNPASASPADQDAMAQALLSWQGAAPWGGGC